MQNENKRIQMSYEQAKEISANLLDVVKTLFGLKVLESDVLYELIRNNTCFELVLFDYPDDLGYCSILPDYDPSSYVVCHIEEKRPNGAKKYEMDFGLDIEKKTFLELFEIIHYNSVGIIREYGSSYTTPLELELKDTVIL